MESWRHVWPVETICRVMQVSPRGYRSWRSRPVSQRARTDMRVLAHIREQYSLSLGSYGRPRMTMELKEVGLAAGERRVGRLMRINGIKPVRTRKHKVTTNSNHRQLISNLMDSAGAMRRYDEPERARELIAAAKANGVGVMGIRAVQAGALTAGIDRPLKPSHPEVKDFARAAPFRTLCADLNINPAIIAHRYALDIPGVDTVVLGVKNPAELGQCLEAEALVPLSSDLRSQIDGLGMAPAG